MQPIVYILLIVFLLAIGVSLIFIVRQKALKKRVIAKLAKMDTTTIRPWTVEFLEAKRQHTDTLGDNTIRAIMAKAETDEVNHLFSLFDHNKQSSRIAMPPELSDYFAQTSILPEWADPDLIALGEQIYLRHGFWVSLMLSYKSLPECYVCAKGAEVLHRTARLNEHHGSLETYSRRISETAQFVMFAMSPGGLSPKGKGLVAAQKVRLIHAIIRYYIISKGWDEKNLGKPINQEDMAGTLMSFSALILEGMESMGIELEAVEKEAYIHCWRVIGHIVGLDDDLIPLNAADAIKLGNIVIAHQRKASTAGAEMAAALLQFLDAKSKPIFSPKANVAMMRLMMGTDLSDDLRLPPANAEDVKKLNRRIHRIASIGEFLDKSLVFAFYLQLLTRFISERMLKRMTRADVIHFYLPTSLTRDWSSEDNENFGR